MSDLNWSELLSKKPVEAKEPVQLPVGHYAMRVVDYEQITSAKKGTPGIQFTFQPFEAREVDEDALQEFLGDDGQEALLKKRLKGNDTTFWLSENSIFMLRRFLMSLGFNMDPDDDTSDTRSLGEILPETKGMEFLGEMGQESYQNAEGNTVIRTKFVGHSAL